MNENLPNQLTQAAIAANEAADLRHEIQCAEIKKLRIALTRIRVFCVLAVVITALLTGLVHWHWGYPLAERLGAIPTGTLSGQAEHEELLFLREEIKTVQEERRSVKQKNQNLGARHKNLVEVVRAKNEELKKVDDLKLVNGLQEKETDKLKNQIAELNRQLALKENAYDSLSKIRHERKESLEIMTGILFDDLNLLKKAETSNPFRKNDTYGKPHLFTFENWNFAWQEKMLDRAIEIGSTNVLGYIASQKGWSDHISKELEEKTMLALTAPHEVIPVIAQQHRRKEAMRKVRLFQSWYHDDPRFVDGSKYPLIPLETLSNTWLSNFLENCRRDNRTNMLQYLQLNLEKNDVVPAAK